VRPRKKPIAGRRCDCSRPDKDGWQLETIAIGAARARDPCVISRTIAGLAQARIEGVLVEDALEPDVLAQLVEMDRIDDGPIDPVGSSISYLATPGGAFR